MYLYSDLQKDCCRLCKMGVASGTAGKTIGGSHIIFFHVGSMEGQQLLIQGGIHGREWVTSLLIVRQVYALAEANPKTGIYFLPMTNPDGCTLAMRGANAFPERAAALKQMNGSDNFTMWKANLRGVDINCNFDARWGEGAGNTHTPSPMSNAGPSAMSENETRALAAFTHAVKPAMTISYHALGREVYYEFGQTGNALARDRYIAEDVAKFLGYKLVHGDLGSAGGYKDWCIQRLGIPALTIEIVGEEHRHPLSERDLQGEEKNIWLPTFLTKYIHGS